MKDPPKAALEIQSGGFCTDPNHGMDSASKDLLNLHIAEYQMLTSRGTYMMVTQVQTAVVILLSVAFFSNLQIWQTLPPRLLIWGGFLLLQLIALYHAQSQLEIYKAILYIETKLRPSIEKLIKQTGCFWQYETFVAVDRGERPQWWEGFVPIAAFILLVLVTTARLHYFPKEPVTLNDFIGIGLNVLTFIFLAVLTLKSLRIRFKWVSIMRRR